MNVLQLPFLSFLEILQVSPTEMLKANNITLIKSFCLKKKTLQNLIWQKFIT
jgi:hypothetical protein